NRDARSSDKQRRETSGPQSGTGIGGQQKVAAKSAARVAELIDGEPRDSEERGCRKGAHGGDEESIGSELGAVLVGQEGDERQGEYAHGAGAAVAQVEAQPVRDQRCGFGAEEGRDALVTILPIDLGAGSGSTDWRQALQTDEQRQRAG